MTYGMGKKLQPFSFHCFQGSNLNSTKCLGKFRQDFNFGCRTEYLVEKSEMFVFEMKVSFFRQVGQSERKVDKGRHSSPHSPSGVLEGVLVVEGDEEAEDGEEHDGVADDHQHAGTPVDLE